MDEELLIDRNSLVKHTVEPIASTTDMSQEIDEEAPLALVDGFNEDMVDKQVEPVEDGTGVLCEVCYSEYRDQDFFALKCGHKFCYNC